MPIIGPRRAILNARPIPWTPAALGSALLCWFDASYLPSLTFIGSNVSSWVDRMSGLSTSQATGANQPVWSASARNGKPGLTFSNQSLVSGAQTVLPSGGAIATMMVAGYGNVNNSSSSFAFGWGSASAGKLRGMEIVSGKLTTSFYSNDHTTTSNWYQTDRFYLEYLDATTSPNSIIYADDILVGSAALTTLSTTASTSFRIGLSAAGSAFVGTLQQILIMNRAPTTPERQKLAGWESWIDGKAGSNLPIGHPYKLRPPYVSDP